MNVEYKKYLSSPEWASVRADILSSRGNKCERCGRNSNLHVHHVSYKNIFNEDPSDLEVLCSGCHKGEHFGLNKKKKKACKYSLAQKVLMIKKRKRNKIKKW